MSYRVVVRYINHNPIPRVGSFEAMYGSTTRFENWLNKKEIEYKRQVIDFYLVSYVFTNAGDAIMFKMVWG